MKELILRDKNGNEEKMCELPEEAVKGLISAIEDVKAGRYITLTNEDEVRD